MEKGLIPTLKLSLEMTDVLARVERVGLKINMDTLRDREDVYRRARVLRGASQRLGA